jgi:hypothetical protein
VFNAGDNGFNSTLSVDNVVGNITPIPTPALLPGLIGMGIATLRKKNQEEAVEQEA